MQSGGYSPKAMGSGCWAHDRERKATGPFHPQFRQRADAATGQGTVSAASSHTNRDGSVVGAQREFISAAF